MITRNGTLTGDSAHAHTHHVIDKLDPPGLQKLLEYRISKGISNAQLAKDLGPIVNNEDKEGLVDTSTVHRWFNGSVPDLAHQLLIEALVPEIERGDWLTVKDRARLALNPVSARDRVETDPDDPPTEDSNDPPSSESTPKTETESAVGE